MNNVGTKTFVEIIKSKKKTLINKTKKKDRLDYDNFRIIWSYFSQTNS